jgi:hypothetical protein
LGKASVKKTYFGTIFFKREDRSVTLRGKKGEKG